MKKLEPIAGMISLVLGIISVATIYWGVGFFIAYIGVIFGLVGYGYDNSKMSMIGTYLNFAVIGLGCISLSLDGKYIKYAKVLL